MVRGYAQIVALASDCLAPCVAAHKVLAHLAASGVRVGDDLCVPPHHEEPTRTPLAAHAEATKKKPPEGGFFDELGAPSSA